MLTKIASSLILLAVLTAPGICLGQIDTDPVSPRDDVRDLYERIASSKYVVIGTVRRSQGVMKRLTPELTEKMKTSLNEGVGGTLYTIEVQETLCALKDLTTLGRSKEQPGLVEIFVPHDEPLYVDSRRKEALIAGRRYVIFLKSPDARQQKVLVEAFELNPKATYYRAERGSQGVIPLSTASTGSTEVQRPAMLDKLIPLCTAIRNPTLQGKLAALSQLASSGDPVLEQESEKAANAIKARFEPKG